MNRKFIHLLSCLLLFFSFCSTFAQSEKIKKQIHVLLTADDDNTNIPEATVYAEGNTFKALYRGTSEQSGIAIVNVETGGNFTVTVNHPKFISSTRNIKVDLYGDKNIYVLEFRLKRKKEAERLSNTLNVYVTDANKKPIANASVVVMPGVSAVTNSSGYAKATHRQHPGEYIVVIASANGYKDQRKRVLVGTAQGNAISRPDDFVSFVLEKGNNDRRIFHLTVEVLDDITNEPVKGANVKLQISDGTDVAGTTNEKGEIKFSDMEYGYEGSGKVMVIHKDYNEKWSDVSQDLMTAKDLDERRFLVYIKKKSGLNVSATWDFKCCGGAYKGKLTLIQDGDKISGYFGETTNGTTGEISGRISGTSLTFERRWDGKKQDYNLTVSSDGKTLTGSFSGDRNTSVGTDAIATRK